MAKKITFLVVLLLGLYLASITAFATNTDTTSGGDAIVSETNLKLNGMSLAGSDTGAPITNNGESKTPDNVLNNNESVSVLPELGIIDLIDKYVDMFTNTETESTDNLFVNIKKWNHNGGTNPLSYVLTGSVIPNVDKPSDSSVVVVFYIKENGKYIPLYLTDYKDKKIYWLEKDTTIVSNVDLLYQGSDKTNDVRIVAFRKSDAEKLVIGKNLQITNISITVRKNIIEGIPLIWKNVMEALELNK